MLEQLERLTDFRSQIWVHQSTFGNKSRKAGLLEEPDRRTLGAVAGVWGDRLSAYGFQHSMHVITTIQETLGFMTYGDAAQRCQQLAEAFHRDCEEHNVELISKSDYARYGSSFSGEVSASFPETAEEIREAGRCYALGRDTACVFHLMRAVEHGLRALVGALGVVAPIVPLKYQEWHNLLQQIESLVKGANINGWTRPSKPNALAFLNGTIADAHAFKDEVRNVLMHTRKGGTYDHAGAQSVMNRVQRFFERLVKQGIAEGETTPLLDPSRFIL